MWSEKVLFEKRNVENYRNKKRKNQSTSHTLLAYHVVIFDTPVLWKIDENSLQRSYIHEINENTFSFQLWRKLNYN